MAENSIPPPSRTTRFTLRKLYHDNCAPPHLGYDPCVQHIPSHFLHGPSPLRQCVLALENSKDQSPHVASRPPTRWRGARRLYEGPRLLKDVECHRLPPHLSLWQADRRERAAFFRGQHPPYFMCLSEVAICPIKDVEMACPSSDETMSSVDTQHPDWCPPSSHSERPPRWTLPRPLLDPEAGLRLRHIRIASACTLFPQLAVAMQTLLNKEIKAAMQREEMDLLAQIQNVTSRPSLGPRGLKRPRSDVGPTSQSERMLKKLRMAAVTASKPHPFVRRSFTELVAMQPQRSHLYASDFLAENEILERAWIESMMGRVQGVDLRKAFLLDCFMRDIRRTQHSETRFAILSIMDPRTTSRACRQKELAWLKEHGTFTFRNQVELYRRFASSWLPYRGQLPSPKKYH
ncbi:hypothetical protein BS47DRAFT_1340250 [Hydnum rufescens UP504]|uniref:Uncharacterized protein n=1 Tax=Hydnum rufescens UP504 TaxID=1448309 RepID=A0A9P6B609_9AGAM|nr:hypothetical protein BS47DRAFT_1340250 [Hydnum rufescens UP504]